MNSVRLQELKGKTVFQSSLFFPVCMQKYVALCATVINSSSPYFIFLLCISDLSLALYLCILRSWKQCVVLFWYLPCCFNIKESISTKYLSSNFLHFSDQNATSGTKEMVGITFVVFQVLILNEIPKTGEITVAGFVAEIKQCPIAHWKHEIHSFVFILLYVNNINKPCSSHAEWYSAEKCTKYSRPLAEKQQTEVLSPMAQESIIFHPCERSWKRLSGLFSSLWKKSMCFRLIVAVIFSINLSLSQMFFGYDFFAYCFSLFTCVLKMHSWWYSLKHDCFFYSKSSGSVRIAEMSSALITVLSS